MKRLLILVVGFCLFCAGAGVLAAGNIALGKPYTWEAAPRYGGCTDDGDTLQLTDGKFSSEPGLIWLQMSTVGWQDTTPIVFTVDLGKTEPIAGVGYSTASDSDTNVAWPFAVFVMVSDDQTTWRNAGDLVRLARPDGTLPPRGSFMYKTESLQTKGRYVRFVVVQRARFTFVDEVQVYKGADSLLAQAPKGEVVSDLTKLTRTVATNVGIRNRLAADMKAVRDAVAASKLPQAKKTALYGKLDTFKQAASKPPQADPDTFKAVFPINDLHAKILAVNSVVLRSRGMPALTAAKVDRYDYITPLNPTSTEKPRLSIDMLKGEFRADAIALTNASDSPVTVKVDVKGLPGSATPKWLTLSAVPWTDTVSNEPVAAALPAAPLKNGSYVLNLPAGLQTKLWVGVDSAGVASGSYDCKLVITGEGKPIVTPFTLKVSKIKMERPRLSLGMWDYAADGRFDKNTAAAIEMMRSHFVDSPWSTNWALPWPAEKDFDATGNLVNELDFSNFDKWVKMWPDARRYLVFANVQNWMAFGGSKMGTPEFDTKVGAWAKAVEDHLRSLNLQPEQLGLLLIDEPSSDALDEQIAAWAQAIKSASHIVIFQDPVWMRPQDSKFQDAIVLADILCPMMSYYFKGGPEVAQYYDQLKADGKQVWFYQCNGPIKLFDPYRYQRLQAWHAFKHGMVGEGFWSFFDGGGGNNCWNEYVVPGACYSPTFLQPDGFTTGIHWEATREGVEDYEYLAMLRDAAEKCRNSKLQSEALKLIDEAAATVTDNYSDVYTWSIPTDHSEADTYRLKVLGMLEKLAK